MAINYTEKGLGLHKAITDAGHWLRRKDNVWIASDDAAVQAIIDAYDYLAVRKAERLAEIRQQAKSLIEAKWPAWRQNNCALGVYPESEAQQCADDIASVVAASNSAEDAIDSAVTVAEVEAVAATWPTI